MKIMRLAAVCGSPCGIVSLSLLLDGIDLENGRYILSLRDEHFVVNLPRTDGALRNFCGSYTLGEARALLVESLDSGARRLVRVSIESPNISDFLDLYRKVYDEKLGIPVENFDRPTHRLEELSFIGGIRNDLIRLRHHVADSWRAL